MQRIEKLHIFTDAACLENPGKASVSVIVKDGKESILEEFSSLLQNSTSNRAEYFAILKALELALKYCRNEVIIFTDSKLVANQLNGVYRIKSQELLQLVKQIKLLELLFKKVRYIHIPRKNNRKADKLAKKTLTSCSS